MMVKQKRQMVRCREGCIAERLNGQHMARVGDGWMQRQTKG